MQFLQRTAVLMYESRLLGGQNFGKAHGHFYAAGTIANIRLGEAFLFRWNQIPGPTELHAWRQDQRCAPLNRE